jgi:hypothetical protein
VLTPNFLNNSFSFLCFTKKKCRYNASLRNVRKIPMVLLIITTCIVTELEAY